MPQLPINVSFFYSITFIKRVARLDQRRHVIFSAMDIPKDYPKVRDRNFLIQEFLIATGNSNLNDKDG